MRIHACLRALGVAAALATAGCDRPASEAVAGAKPAASRQFSLHPKPKPVPDLVFQNERGQAVRLSAFRGKVLVLNVWATWCAPCREEMPTLDRLQAQLGGPDFEVLALSVDHEGQRVVQKFFRDIGVKHLHGYVDPSPQTLDQLKVLGLPATLLLDPQGRELGRLLGATHWDSPEMVAFLREVIARHRTAQAPQKVRRDLGAAAG